MILHSWNWNYVTHQTASLILIRTIFKDFPLGPETRDERLIKITCPTCWCGRNWRLGPQRHKSPACDRTGSETQGSCPHRCLGSQGQVGDPATCSWISSSFLCLISTLYAIELKEKNPNLSGLSQRKGACPAVPVRQEALLGAWQVHERTYQWAPVGPTWRYCQLAAPLGLDKKDTGMKHKESEMEMTTKKSMKDSTKLCK